MPWDTVTTCYAVVDSTAACYLWHQHCQLIVGLKYSFIAIAIAIPAYYPLTAHVASTVYAALLLLVDCHILEMFVCCHGHALLHHANAEAVTTVA